MNIDPDLPTFFLKPSELCFVRKPALIRTVLGSCVTVTMFCRRLGAAAACHPVLPACPQVKSCNLMGCQQRLKYVECVIPEMLRRFVKIGALRSELEIKLFGGANMFTRNATRGEILHVGDRNVSMALQMLDELELTMQGSDVGGNRGRKIMFDTGTGDVWVRRFQPNAATREELTVMQTQLTMQMKTYER